MFQYICINLMHSLEFINKASTIEKTNSFLYFQIGPWYDSFIKKLHVCTLSSKAISRNCIQLSKSSISNMRFRWWIAWHACFKTKEQYICAAIQLCVEHELYNLLHHRSYICMQCWIESTKLTNCLGSFVTRLIWEFNKPISYFCSFS